jgi:hypothetical protein
VLDRNSSARANNTDRSWISNTGLAARPGRATSSDLSKGSRQSSILYIFSTGDDDGHASWRGFNGLAFRNPGRRDTKNKGRDATPLLFLLESGRWSRRSCGKRHRSDSKKEGDAICGSIHACGGRDGAGVSVKWRSKSSISTSKLSSSHTSLMHNFVHVYC